MCFEANEYSSDRQLIGTCFPTGECGGSLQSPSVLPGVSDDELGSCWDLRHGVEEDRAVRLAGPQVRRSSARARHLYRLHPVGAARVAAVDVMRRTPVVVEYLAQNRTRTPVIRAYSKRVPRTNCALRIKKCAPRISSGIYFLGTS